MEPERTVRYADSGGLQIAFEVIGDGPLDIVTAFEHASNIDLMHEHPRIDRYLRRFGEFGRLIHVDLRGVGLSDAMEQVPPLEDWVDDVRAVMSAVGSERAALIGHGYGAQLLMLFAAMHPELTSALVTINGYARLRRAPDYPGVSRSEPSQPCSSSWLKNGERLDPGLIQPWHGRGSTRLARAYGAGFCYAPTCGAAATNRSRHRHSRRPDHHQRSDLGRPVRG